MSSGMPASGKVGDRGPEFCSGGVWRPIVAGFGKSNLPVRVRLGEQNRKKSCRTRHDSSFYCRWARRADKVTVGKPWEGVG